LDRYARAQACFDEVMVAIPAGAWDGPSACADWTRRDVLGHVVWGQELVCHLATGQDYESRLGRDTATVLARA
ncbi:MAG: maleylpyruvate isomerase N-terminal domain-containing protein, partial [Nocardioidaceae bacterium]